MLSPPLISHRQARHFLSSTLPRGKDNGSENATPSLEGEATTPCSKLQVSRTTYSSLLFCLCQIIIYRVAQLSLKGFPGPACTPMFWFSHLRRANWYKQLHLIFWCLPRPSSLLLQQLKGFYKPCVFLMWLRVNQVPNTQNPQLFGQSCIS